jgi:hypothetical protein
MSVRNESRVSGMSLRVQPEHASTLAIENPPTKGYVQA